MLENNQMSTLEVAIDLMRQKKKPQQIINLLREVLEMKGLDDPDGEIAAQLYIDITSSALFVYCGNGEWDLKTRQPLELWDRDGSAFSDGEVVEDDEEEDITLDDYKLDDDEEDDIEDEEEDEIEEEELEELDIIDDEVGFDVYSDDDMEVESDYLDEQVYNDIMDDYEDMYEDK